ncbi:hypothetical protein EFU43_17165 [Vibrio cholerae]|nr:hypothetical protein [Vibrio cholerae]
MTYTYRDLKLAMQGHRPLSEVAEMLASMLKSGFQREAVIQYMCSYIDDSNIEDDYENVLDDLISAMEGDCNKNYILHPSHFVQIRHHTIIHV